MCKPATDILKAPESARYLATVPPFSPKQLIKGGKPLSQCNEEEGKCALIEEHLNSSYREVQPCFHHPVKSYRAVS